MFNTYQVGPRSLDVTVRELRAPTDESVRLLREMEEKARGQVVEALRLSNMGAEIVVHRYDDLLNLKTCFAIHYKLNGHKREVRLSIEDYRSDIRANINAVWRAVGEDIAMVLVGSTTKQIVGNDR